MDTKTTDPLAGKPRTRRIPDAQGKTSYETVLDTELPLGRMVADKVSPWLGVFLALRCIWIAPATVGAFVAAVAFGVVGWLTSLVLIRTLLRARTTFRTHAEIFSVRRFWGWEHFNRKIEHSFELIPHKWARHETARHDLSVRKAAVRGRAIQPKPYFQASFHLVLRYGGRRVVIATIHGEALAVDARNKLALCDRQQDAANRARGGIGDNPESEWSTNAPGGFDHA
jgi:hypothetical protein